MSFDVKSFLEGLRLNPLRWYVKNEKEAPDTSLSEWMDRRLEEAAARLPDPEPEFWERLREKSDQPQHNLSNPSIRKLRIRE